jgi:hypothetical protein
MDFDPRDYDSRDDERFESNQSRGSRGRSDDRDRDDDWSEPHIRSRDRDDDARTLGRGPGSDSRASHVDENSRDRHHDARWPDRDRDPRERSIDHRDVFTRNLDLPRGLERELVRDRDREYTLRGSESRTLATVGAFRVVSSRDLRDHHDRPADLRSGDLRHLREQRLIETVRVPGYREHALVLTKEGRSLLERHREGDHIRQQTFYAGLKRERELEHDVQVYRAYEREAESLHGRGARVNRVLLDYELKRDYQKWLHERDRDRDDYDGHPDRTTDEIRDWALEHDLPYFDDKVHFPDLRIEYQEPDGRWDHNDIEVTTEHYRGAHAASVARSGFSCYGGSSFLICARSSAGRGGGGRHRGLAEEFWR